MLAKDTGRVYKERRLGMNTKIKRGDCVQDGRSAKYDWMDEDNFLMRK